MLFMELFMEFESAPKGVISPDNFPISLSKLDQYPSKTVNTVPIKVRGDFIIWQINYLANKKQVANFYDFFYELNNRSPWQ